MVLGVAYAVISSIIPSGYYLPVAAAGVVLVVLYAFAQGRTTTRDRDLHARFVLVTGAFTPLGLTLLTSLAKRGAHIIALSPYPLEHPYPSLIIPLLRSTTKNENIFVEHADLHDPISIRAFCTRFLTGNEQRLDAIVFAHEYHGLGSLFGLGRRAGSDATLEKQRDERALATFLMTTLLLPVLLVAPNERDIRIVNVVNPFYAAAALTFRADPPPSQGATFLQEGRRALRTVVLTRHLQRVLDSLPNRAAEPSAGGPGSKDNSAAAKLLPHPSNIVAVSVCPGVSRRDTVAPLFAAERDAEGGSSLLGLILYTLLFPLFFVTTKHAQASVESVLHVLFLPTPFKRAVAQVNATVNPAEAGTDADAGERSARKTPEEVLKPGALYRECAVVQLAIPAAPVPAPAPEPQTNDAGKGKGKGKKGEGDKEKEEVPLEFPDDGEFGGESLGRTVWEWYEEKLKMWEADAKANAEAKAETEKQDKSKAEAEEDESKTDGGGPTDKQKEP